MAQPRLKMRLGDLLVAEMIITDDQLQLALQQQRQTGRKLGTTLVDLGFIGEEQLLKFLAQQLNIPFFDLSKLTIQTQAVQLINSLNLLQLGDEQAQLMGVALRRLRWQLVLAVCLLSGFAVALAGSIGFIGLLIPHLMRLLGRGSARFVLVASLLAGASTLLLADLLSRNLLPSGELPVGILTATLGAPLLIYLLVRRHA